MSTATLRAPATTSDSGVDRPSVNLPIPPLENGAHLSATEFLRRYEAMPEVKKAELIQGVVYMSSPVRANMHGVPDNMLQVWAGSYAEATPNVQTHSNSTVRFGPDDIPQPDILIRIYSEKGGRAHINQKDYIVGPPELVIEVAASSASVDMNEKLETYRRYGVQEYLLWLTEQNEIRWLQLEEDEYRPIPVASDGFIHSRVLPGLWLDSAAMCGFNRAGVRAALERGLASPEHAAFVK